MSQTKAQLIDPVDGTIVNADINASAAIAGTKVSPDFGSQNITTTGIVKIADGSVSAPAIAFTDDLDTGIFSVAQNTINVTTGGVERLEIGTSLTVFNDGGADVDFRIEGDTDANLFKVDAGNDRIGIGISAPQQKLHIAVPDSGAANIVFTNSTTGSASSDGLVIGLTGAEDGQINMQESANLKFSTADTERMRIDSSGRVGIGTTSPDAPLTIHNSSDPEIRFGYNSSQDHRISWDGSKVFIHADPENANGSSAIALAVDGTARLYITDAGNVGIGTTSPSQKLEIDGSLSLKGANRQIIIMGSGTCDHRINSPAGSNDLVFDVNKDSENVTANFVFRGSQSGGGTNTELMKIVNKQLHFGNGAINHSKCDIGGIDVSSGRLSIVMGGTTAVGNGDTRTDSSQKEARLAVPHYTLAEEPSILLCGFNSSSGNAIHVGGGTSLGNNATEISFHCASNTTTTGSNIVLSLTPSAITTAAAGVIRTQSSAGSLTLFGGNTNHGGEIVLAGGNSSSNIIFKAQAGTGSPAERMRLASDGDFLIGTTSGISGGVAGAEFHAANNSELRCGTTGTGNSTQIRFYNNNGEVGAIRTNGSATVYHTSSDYRRKENAVAISDGITRLKTLKPYRFNFKADSSTILDGFFAHEVSPVVPEAISGTKDEVDSNGNPVYQGIDQSKLVPLLVAAVKELITKVETLEAA